MSFDVEDLVALGRLGACALSPDGSWVAATVSALSEDGTKYVPGLWRVPTDGSVATPLLEGPYSDSAPAFDRTGALHFLSNRTPEAMEAGEPPADDAVTQVWRLRAGGGADPVTDEPLGVRAFRIARRADVIVLDAPVLPGVERERMAEVAKDLAKGPSLLRYTRMPVRFWDAWLGERSHHLVALTASGRRVLTPDREDPHPEWAWDVSDDGATVVHHDRIEGIERLWGTEMVVVDVATGERRVLFGDAHGALGGAWLSPDGATVATVHAPWVKGEAWNGAIVLVTLADGSARTIAADWDVHPDVKGWSRDGASLLVTADFRGRVPLWSVDAGSGERRVLVDDGSVHDAIIAEDQLLFTRSSVLEPPHLVRLGLVDGERRPLARLDDLGVDLAALLQVEELFVPAADGVPVQLRVVRRRDLDGQAPLLLWIHGGPIGAWADGWHWRWPPAVAAMAGFVVALPNPRGSTGFGQAFVQGIWGNTWGGACFDDLMRVTDELSLRPDVDEDAMVAMGGSFGGYMTNWIATQTDRFACCVTHAGLWDFSAFHGVTDFPAWWVWMFGVDPWHQAEELARFSPRAHADDWTIPALILHGQNDYRVPISDALAQFEALQARGVECELAVFTDENHWILKPRNIIAWMETWMEFVGRVC